MDHHGREGAVLSERVRTVAETGSTNADMLALAGAGIAEGVVIIAPGDAVGGAKRAGMQSGHGGGGGG